MTPNSTHFEAEPMFGTQPAEEPESARFKKPFSAQAPVRNQAFREG